MAVTQNTYTGNGSTVLFSFTFPYLETTDIKVSVNGTVTTAYTLANATTIQFNTAPANGAAIRIYRQTDDSALAATFYPGSAIRSNDLNENFTQNLYVTQESSNNAATATSTANTALTNSTTALSTANTALSTANTASTNASTAVGTANTANSNASAAVSTANTANANASSALSAVSSALLFIPVANVAAIPSSPTNGQAVRVLDSTGIQSFTPLSGVPVGFVGNSALNVEIYYQTSTSSWVWNSYSVTDPENRYLKLSGGTLTGQLRADDSTSTAVPVYSFDGDVNTGIAHTGADELALVTGGVVRFTLDPSGNAVFNQPVTIPAGSTVTGYAALATTQTFTAAQRGAVSVLTSAATVTPNFATANNFSLTLGHSLTIANPTNLTAGQSGAIVITQGSGTAYTVAYGSNWKFSGGTPTMSTALSSVSTLVYYVESATRITARLITNVT